MKKWGALYFKLFLPVCMVSRANPTCPGKPAVRLDRTRFGWKLILAWFSREPYLSGGPVGKPNYMLSYRAEAGIDSQPFD